MRPILRRQRRAAPTSRTGMTTLEVLVVSVVLAVALNSLAAAIINTMKLGPVNRENAIAMDAARQVIESIQDTEFDEIFARYNADASDDPVVPVPGAAFAVDGLELVDGDADGMAGAIEFPEIGGEIREDYDDRAFGMPRDLNQDGTIDAVDHAADYAVLPFRIRIQWEGDDGQNRDFVVYSQVTRR